MSAEKKILNSENLFKRGLLLMYIYTALLLLFGYLYTYESLIWGIILWIVATVLIISGIVANKTQTELGYLSYSECLPRYRAYFKRTSLKLAAFALIIFAFVLGVPFVVPILVLYGIITLISSFLGKKHAKEIEIAEEDNKRTQGKIFIFCAWLMNPNTQRSFILFIISLSLIVLFKFLGVEQEIVYSTLIIVKMLAEIFLTVGILQLL